MKKELQDKAWAVLPKEFREEVKDIFLSSPHIGMMRILVDIFGYDNIIHNTETEEMLTVSSRKVVDLYKKFNPPPFGLSRDRHAGIMFAIEQLFGSKCLLDESRNVESKPMFEVGDKVLISDDPRLPKEYRGRIGRVVLIYAGDIYTVDVGNGVVPDTFHISHLTPYTEQKYKVGDKIRVTNIVPEKYVGSVGVVKSFSKGFYNIELLDGGGVMSREEDLEPYGNDLLSENEENENNDHIVGNEHKLRNERYNTDGETYLLDPRIQVAAAAMQGMLSNPNIVMSCGDLDDNQEDITKHAVEYSDDLLKKFGIIIIKKTEK